MLQNKNTSNSFGSLLVAAMSVSKQRTADAIIARQNERAEQDGSTQNTAEQEAPVAGAQQPAF